MTLPALVTLLALLTLVFALEKQIYEQLERQIQKHATKIRIRKQIKKKKRKISPTTAAAKRAPKSEQLAAFGARKAQRTTSPPNMRFNFIFDALDCDNNSRPRVSASAVENPAARKLSQPAGGAKARKPKQRVA